MKTRSKEINIFSMSALDLFASALGAFILITVILLPYFPNTGDSPERVTKVRKELEQTKEELNKTKQELEQAKKSEQRSESKFPDLDLVIVLDTTGSMGKSIEGLKQEVEQLAEVLLKLSPSLNLSRSPPNDAV